LIDQGFEGLRFAHRDIGQDFPVDLDAGRGEAADKSAIGQAVLADRSVYALNPKSAEIPLSQLPPDIGVLHRTVDRGIGRGDVVLAAAIEALGLLENALAAKP
jgi:hypothetical protein